MKVWMKFSFAIVLLLALAIPGAALAQGSDGDKVVTGGSFTLRNGESIDGNLYILGGVATLEEGSTVEGDVYLAGGTLRVSGEVDGSIFGAGGLIDLRGTAEVRGDINVLGANVNRDPGAFIGGEMREGIEGPFRVRPPVVLPRGDLGIETHPFWQGLWFLVRTFLWAALAILVVLFAPRSTRQVANTVLKEPIISGGLGLLTLVAGIVTIVIFAITIIGIPVALLLAFLIGVAWAYGLVVIGVETGRRLSGVLNQQWALPVAAGVGTFLVVLVLNGLDWVLPCFGWLAKVLVGGVGLGAVMLTRFGTQPYPSPAVPADIAPRAPVDVYEAPRRPVIPPEDRDEL